MSRGTTGSRTRRLPPCVSGQYVIGALLLAGASIVAASGHGAELAEARQAADRVERRLDGIEARRSVLATQAREAEHDLRILRESMVDTALSIMARHEEMEAIVQELGALEAEVALRHRRLTRQRQRMAKLIGGLQRMSRIPAAVVVGQPEVPLDTVRGAMLLRAALPSVKERSRAITTELVALEEIRSELMARHAEAQAARDELNLEIGALADMVQQRETLLDRSTARRDHLDRDAEALAEQASSLRDLMERIERAAALAPADEPEGADSGQLADRLDTAAPDADRTPPPTPDPAASAALSARMLPLPLLNGVILPSSGQVVVQFGQPNHFGEHSNGLSIEAYPGAPVVSPLDGSVRYAGPFRGYGQILILEHPGEYHSLIAGVGRIDVGIGQQVLAGEPVGAAPMPRTTPGNAPRLYFEFRRHGQPINPLKGLAAAQGRGRG